jgi:hypothetical protein
LDANGLNFKKAVSFKREPYTNTIQYGFTVLYNQAFINGASGPYILTQAVTTTTSIEGLTVTGSTWFIVDMSGDFPIDVISAVGYSGNQVTQHSILNTAPLNFTPISKTNPRIFDYTGGLEQVLTDSILLQSIQTVDATVTVDNAGAGGIMYMYRDRPERVVILKQALSMET